MSVKIIIFSLFSISLNLLFVTLLISVLLLVCIYFSNTISFFKGEVTLSLLKLVTYLNLLFVTILQLFF